MSRLLLVEDDQVFSSLVKQALVGQKYTVDSTRDGEEGLELLRSNQYACAILDWELPNLTGPEICKAYRESGGKTPIIMLTRRTRVSEKVCGFEAGVDDYLAKPFDLEELFARLKALMRRPALAKPLRAVEIGNLVVDSEKRSAFVRGESLDLSTKEFILLELLANNRGRLFSAEDIIGLVWSLDKDVSVWA
ncbi:MAG: response regulator transcription factor, partial [Cyanobacteria bacterium]|nr:response regulator transcription factor [Cyanobacteriota bacterium]